MYFCFFYQTHEKWYEDYNFCFLFLGQKRAAIYPLTGSNVARKSSSRFQNSPGSSPNNHVRIMLLWDPCQQILTRHFSSKYCVKYTSSWLPTKQPKSLRLPGASQFARLILSHLHWSYYDTFFSKHVRAWQTPPRPSQLPISSQIPALSTQSQTAVWSESSYTSLSILYSSLKLSHNCS